MMMTGGIFDGSVAAYPLALERRYCYESSIHYLQQFFGDLKHSLRSKETKKLQEE